MKLSLLEMLEKIEHVHPNEFPNDPKQHRSWIAYGYNKAVDKIGAALDQQDEDSATSLPCPKCGTTEACEHDALAQQETDVTKVAGWCALCEEPNGCHHGHSEEEWIAANHRMIEQRRAALAQQDEHRGMQSRSCSIHGELLTCPICDANQAQPPCQHRRRTTFLDGSKVVDCECGAPWPCSVQQAQADTSRMTAAEASAYTRSIVACEHECANGTGDGNWKCTECGHVFPDSQ